MPRRTSARVLVSSSTTPQDFTTVSILRSTDTSPDVLDLRRQWKWAAFSQFFFTFNSLFAMNDVNLIDIENDLVHSTSLVLPRVMQRLLQTLTQDRKISLDNWQIALRKQYYKRDPNANPIGPIEQLSNSVIAHSSRASTVPRDQSVAASEPHREYDNETWSNDAPSANKPEDPTIHDGGVDPVDASASKPVDEAIQPEETGKSLDWLDLPMLTKLDSLYTLQEWQFQNPPRLRTLMKDDDESAQWRIEPIGYDAKRNAYWLIGADRLWIQRELPRTNLKRKRDPANAREQPSKETKRQNQARGAKSQPPKRQRIESESNSTSARTTRRSTRVDTIPVGSRGPRAAKSRANQRLDAQAKDLANFQNQMAGSSSSRVSKDVGKTSLPRKPPAGIRLSARLRGSNVEEEWQEIPEEWLEDSTSTANSHQATRTTLTSAQRALTTGLESDAESISDLTELSEDSNTEDAAGASDEVGKEAAQQENDKVDHKNASPETDDPPGNEVELGSQSAALPNGFVEWDTICVTLEEWESISERFEKATHYAEKALYKTLITDIVPIITAELRETERKKRAEDAIVHRKRSSRIAMKESEKEEERLLMKQKVEEEEKLSRAKRLEARIKKEEADRQRRETAREQRRKEREQKVSEESKPSASPAPIAEIVEPVPLDHFVPPQLSHSRSNNSQNFSGSGSRTPVEDWELDCEVCHRRGINQDDGTPIMSCGLCSKWQHIICHDRQEYHAGRPKRNWDAEEFICQRCRLAQSMSHTNGHHTSSLQLLPVDQRTQSHHSSMPSSYHSNAQPPVAHDHGGNYLNQTSTTARHNYEHQASGLRTSAAPSQPSSHTHEHAHSSVTFAHYQPQQGGFSTSRPTYSFQEPVRLPVQQQYMHTVSPHASQASGMNQYPASSQSLPSSTHDKWSNGASYPRNDMSYSINGHVNPHSYTQISPYYGTHPSVPPPAQNPHLRGGHPPMGQYSYPHHAYPHTG
ncbi:hypothetical protein BJ138DRAFT_1148631 [Hygrophoropsis aurantiaca]|uniref:Uncharacterized protein n=1 Tax=Hygrophoropsis aurantiaca TaxID=72124 RepID=A0ACB8AGM7_9AGAM|nr:hypothetical protein BJ138DRAFT_1148631 [Hygrophoropsis aurantiaca]